MYSSDDIPTRLVNLPHHVPGLSSVTEEGEPMIYLNARLTFEQNRQTFEHELKHINSDDFFNSLPIELVETDSLKALQQLPIEQTPSEQQELVNKEPQLKPKNVSSEKSSLQISDNLRQEAHRLFDLEPNDLRWDAIIYAMLVTGCHEIEPTKRVNRTYYFKPVKVKKGVMYAMGNETPRLLDEQRRFLRPFNKHI